MIYKAVFHINMDDEKALAIALVNVTNLLKNVNGKPYDLVVLFNGPAVNAMVEKNCVNHSTKILELQKESVSFKVCNIALEKFEINTQELVAGCEVIAAGIVHLIDLQNEGYAYIKP